MVANILRIIAIILLMLDLLAFTLFLIKGGNMNKSEFERRLEDEEQMKYLKEYNEKKNRRK